MRQARTTLGIIGGSNFYDFDSLKDIQNIPIHTPFGWTPDPIIEGWLGDTRLLFASRHGRGHRFLPHEVPYQAIIFALKKLGAERVIGVSAVGSLNPLMQPGHLAVVRQYVDATWGRPSSFFGNGIVGHVGMGKPVCLDLADSVFAAMQELHLQGHSNAKLKVMQGPAFSTLAESELNRAAGLDLIGMTSMPEAKLAREAELCYVSLALITDYDCWHESEEAVTAELVTQRLSANVEKAKAVVRLLAQNLPTEKTCNCSKSLDCAVVTESAIIPENFCRETLSTIFGRVLSEKN